MQKMFRLGIVLGLMESEAFQDDEEVECRCESALVQIREANKTAKVEATQFNPLNLYKAWLARNKTGVPPMFPELFEGENKWFSEKAGK